jgi:hypothetical protein
MSMDKNGLSTMILNAVREDPELAFVALEAVQNALLINVNRVSAERDALTRTLTMEREVAKSNLNYLHAALELLFPLSKVSIAKREQLKKLEGYFAKLLLERSYLYGWEEEMHGKILARLAEFEAKDSK